MRFIKIEEEVHCDSSLFPKPAPRVLILFIGEPLIDDMASRYIHADIANVAHNRDSEKGGLALFPAVRVRSAALLGYDGWRRVPGFAALIFCVWTGAEQTYCLDSQG
jgi:hypothetical protein